MLLKHWAEKQGISYQTALRWFHSGRMPVPARQVVENGSILVDLSDQKNAGVAGVHLYARVSARDQKDDLHRQLERLQLFAAAQGWQVLSTAAEVGSGLNGRRTKLQQLLRQPTGDVVVEHADRLARFGVPYIGAALESAGRKLHVMNKTESKVDLVQDFIDVVTSMCARIYGKRSAKNKAKRALEAVNED